MDHILPRSRGGTNEDSNLQIAHLRCNLLKHDDAQPSPDYARAVLSLALDGTPIPARVWQREHRTRRRPPAWKCDRDEIIIEPWRLVLRYQVWRARRRLARRRQESRSYPSRDRDTAALQPGPSSQIREWAAQHGYELNDRGRIPAAVIEAWRVAQQAS